MQIAEYYIQHVSAWSFVLIRMLGLFMFTPLLASGTVPVQAKAMLAAGFAVVVYAGLPPEQQVTPAADLMDIAPIIAIELAIGLCLGLLAAIPLVTVEVAGHIMGYQMGFSLAQSYNPGLESNLNSIGSLLFFMAITIYFMMGGLDLVVLTLMGTFENVPVGGFDITNPPLELLIGVLTSGFEIAFVVAAPVTAIIFLMLLAMGFLMKTMPQINVMTVGFAVKIIAGILILAISVFAISEALGDHIVDVLEQARGWALSLSGSPQPIGGGGN